MAVLELLRTVGDRHVPRGTNGPLPDSGQWVESSIASIANSLIFSECFMGWLSLILLELNIMSLYQRSMLFCTEWSVFLQSALPLVQRSSFT